MKYIIESSESEVSIKVSNSKGKKQALLEAFRECGEGSSSWSTLEYEKLDSLEIESRGDDISFKLRSKPDQQFDEAEISRCIEYTKGKLGDKS